MPDTSRAKSRDSPSKRSEKFSPNDGIQGIDALALWPARIAGDSVIKRANAAAGAMASSHPIQRLGMWRPRGAMASSTDRPALSAQISKGRTMGLIISGR
jgi:hypothetical protein